MLLINKLDLNSDSSIYTPGNTTRRLFFFAMQPRGDEVEDNADKCMQESAVPEMKSDPPTLRQRVIPRAKSRRPGQDPKGRSLRPEWRRLRLKVEAVIGFLGQGVASSPSARGQSFFTVLATGKGLS